MKRTIIIGMLLASVSAFAFSGHRGAQNLVLDELNLTPAQEKQIKSIHRESRDETIKLMDQMDDLRDGTRKKVMSVLDDEQKTKFIALRKEMRQSSNCKKGCFNHGTMPRKKPICDK